MATITLHGNPIQTTGEPVTYTNFQAGQGKLRALHSAQRSFIDERRQAQGAAHPFFWASFVLVGKAD